MNATGVKLNAQELRNAEFFGEFKTSAYELATEQLYRWRDDWKVFAPFQIARMSEVETTSEFMVLIMSGILDKDAKTIDRFYENFDSVFHDRAEVERRFRLVFDTIDDLLVNDRHELFNTRTMFFALFAAVYGIQFETRTPYVLKPKAKLDLIPLPKDKATPLAPEARGRLLKGAEAIKKRQVSDHVLSATQRATTDANNRRTLINFLVGKSDGPPSG
jgi:hypothetical protein